MQITSPLPDSLNKALFGPGVYCEAGVWCKTAGVSQLPRIFPNSLRNLQTSYPDCDLAPFNAAAYWTMAPSRTLLVIGSGPGISFAVTTLFVSKRYSNVVLIARSVESLAGVKTAVEQTVGSQVTVKTYAVDVTDSAALLEALDDADAVLGKPECVFFNAVRVIFSVFFEHEVNEIEYDLKVNPACFARATMV